MRKVHQITVLSFRGEVVDQFLIKKARHFRIFIENPQVAVKQASAVRIHRLDRNRRQFIKQIAIA